MVLYKTATGSMEKLTFPVDVTYLRENGIDVGVLKAELFTKVSEQAKHEVFEHAEDNLIRKRRGWNFKCSKFLV